MILAALALLGLPTGLADGPSCAKPLRIGEIRTIAHPDLCFDIAGHEGIGEMGWFECDGYVDQIFIFCEDGSLRNSAANMCVRPRLKDNGDIDGRIDSQRCQYNDDDTLHDISRWHIYKEGIFIEEPAKIKQAAFMLRSKAYPDWCVSGVGVTGMMHKCATHPDGWDEQNLYFRTRGAQVATGRLVNWQDPGQVLEVIGRTGIGAVKMYDAEMDQLDQVWALYENGELLNFKQNLCLNNNPGDIVVSPCRNAWEQKWNLGRMNEVDDEGNVWFPIVSKKRDGEGRTICASPTKLEPYHSDVRMLECDWRKFQYFKWDPDINWSTPNGEWSMVGCNMNGDVKQTVTVSTEYGYEISASLALSIETTIAAGIILAGQETSYGISAQLAGSWHSSWSTSSATEVSCKIYDNGEPFVSGCMWQFRLKTDNSGEELQWDPMITRCTSDMTQPTCPPFTYCEDKECTKCYEKGDNLEEKQGVRKGDDFFKGPVPLTDTKPTFDVAPHKQMTVADHRNPRKCSEENTEEACDARADCKALMKKGVMKKCKALKCSKMKGAYDCITANRACAVARESRGRFSKCKKAKRKED